MTVSPRRTLTAVLLVLLAAAAGLIGPAGPAAAAAPYCGITWGSQAKGVSPVPPAAGAVLTNVRAGQHPCYDRLVLDTRGPSLGTSWHVAYVPRVVADGSGAVVPLRGGAFLEVVAGVSDHTGAGVPTYRPADRRELVPVTGFRTLRQVAWAGSFEGLTTVGAGVRARLPFRAFVLPRTGGGSMLVVDVAHRW
ncbi:hypothetical protein [Modestobacter sp. NPDC049651]|uniref:AMIN-like domain-containing (lipo)protein n=1 Tax=unclassified Modestobacter TaxID=2643866 RepID=UPI0033EDB56E